jgi:hypothetical protein
LWVIRSGKRLKWIFCSAAPSTPNLVGISNHDIRTGMKVEVVFDDVTEEITLARFKPLTI